ncbi:hypothetical protein [Streptomyces sp. NPDC096132]|uniref:hypothetical protein n=1 Tax=Streptomyces sp. NPDC096132 TaxID=3366075 RepID=UPI00380FDDEA
MITAGHGGAILQAHLRRRGTEATIPVAADRVPNRRQLGSCGCRPGGVLVADLHLELSPLSREEAVTRLRTWAVEQDTGRHGR